MSRNVKLRVLHVVDRLGMGGAETWLMALLRFWCEQGGEAPAVDILAASGAEGVFDEKARALGSRVFYHRYGKWTAASFARDFRRVLDDGAYQAIHDHQGGAAGWHFLLGGSSLPPVRIAHFHNAISDLTYRPLLGRLSAEFGKTLTLRRATLIAGASRQLMTNYGFDEPRYSGVARTTIYCGIDTSRFAYERSAERARLRREFGWTDDVLVVLSVGRIDPSDDVNDPRIQKNSSFAVSIGLAAAAQEPRVRMLMAGAPSPATPILQRRIAESGRTDTIRLIGVRHDMDRVMLGADVLLFPSRSEGLGLAAVEAQAAGLPVLASDGVPQEAAIVTDLYHILPLRAPIEAWAKRLVEITAGPRPEPSRCRETIDSSDFSIANSARKLEAIYRCEL